MNSKYAVEFENVSKIYGLKQKKGQNTEGNIRKSQKFYALKNISFKVEKGDVVGILGTNGSGKSTLSSILAGIASVDSGKVEIIGEQSLIAINTGLNKQLTGLENIRLKGALLGLSKSKIDKIIDGVIEFSELGDFLYQPVKSYSSGMKSRLGFSISITLDPDILIIDEALSVGDKAFSNKCIKKIGEFKNKGKTIFFVSHSLNQIKIFCNKGLWIEGGSVKEYGDIEDVAKKYSSYLQEYDKKSDDDKEKIRQEIFNSRIIKDQCVTKTEKRNTVFGRCRIIVALLAILLILFSISLMFVNKKDSSQGEISSGFNDKK